MEKDAMKPGSRWIRNYRPMDDVVEISPEYDDIKDFRKDDNFVIIRIDRGEDVIELAVVDGRAKKDENDEPYYGISHIIRGKRPQEIYHYLATEGLLTLPEHYAYVGKELQKAYGALRSDTEYVQE
jgi:hypothetical protein